MQQFTQYHCDASMLAQIEAAFKQDGYAITIPPQCTLTGAWATVMEKGQTCVLLTAFANGSAEIEVWGVARAAAIALLERFAKPLGPASASSRPQVSLQRALGD